MLLTLNEEDRRSIILINDVPGEGMIRIYSSLLLSIKYKIQTDIAYWCTSESGGGVPVDE